MNPPLLEVKNLNTVFTVKGHTVTAVDDVSFVVPEKTMVGIVGESGSGKSVTALSVMGLLAANGKTVGGEIRWQGQDLRQQSAKDWHAVRGRDIGLIFQNPLAALNPVFSIGSQMIETIQLHRKATKTEAKAIAIDLLKQVNIPDPDVRLNDYPHQFSLGMCQRIMIALTLAMQPKLLIADEPTASLDVTIQAQVLALLDHLKSDMSVLLISHDMGVVAQYCDFILVMYLGKIIESGTPAHIFKHPQHPYTQALIGAIPNPDPDHKHKPELLKGDIPSPMNLPSGCRFHTRCPKAMPHCSTQVPQWQVDSTGHGVACWLYS
ncbi:MAG: ABC transporter ATP-binding protein [Candidatus Margulisiibacteriota bacterium]